MDGCKQLNMEDAGFFSNKEPSFKARQLFFQQKLYTVKMLRKGLQEKDYLIYFKNISDAHVMS